VPRQLATHRASGREPALRQAASRPPAAPRGQAGFSLLEVLVAFAILALTLGVLLQIFSHALSTTAVSGSFARAAEVAEATLAMAGVEIPLEEGDHSGKAADGYDWSLRISLVDVSDIFPDQTAPVTPYRVTATAYWTEGDAERHFSLASLRLGGALETAGLGAGAVPARSPRSPVAGQTRSP
jgi:general secretion pathway protein I